MEVPKPHCGSTLHALTPEPGYVAPQLIGTLNAPDTPTPNHAQLEDCRVPQINDHNANLTEIDQNGSQGPQGLGKPSKVVN